MSSERIPVPAQFAFDGDMSKMKDSRRLACLVLWCF